MKSITKILLLFLILTSCQSQDLPTPDTLLRDFKAKQLAKDNKFEEALQNYYDLIEVSPQFYQTHSNVGVILNMIQKEDEALKSFLHALKLAEEKNDSLGQFSLNFNLGVYFGLKKDTQKALQYYQAALEIIPTSVETKTNIELLIQEQSKQGKGEGKSDSQQNQEQNKDGQNNQNQEQKDKGENSDPKQNENNSEDQNEKPEDQKRENSPRYKPKPFKGEQLSEGDVKKILGELRNQEQKIRANYDKKEKGKSNKNEKDW